MRSVWSGNLAFGLVSIPVKLGSAVSSHKIGFRQIHRTDQGRVRYQKTCELDQQVLSASDIGRAYETPDDQLIEVTDDDLKALPLPTAKTIEVTGFLDTASVDMMQLDTPYFVAPSSPAANKPYVLMRDALARSGKAAVGKFAMRNAEHLALIRAHDDVLLLQTLRWPDELNSPADAAPKGKVQISDSELQLADTLIGALGEADLSSYHDDYAQAVEALVTAKLEGAEPPATGGESGGGTVVDLMAALRASVEQARDGGRGDADGSGDGDGAGGRDDHATVTELKPSGGKGSAGRRAPAKKAPGSGSESSGSRSTAKKSAASTSAASKTAASKTGAAKSTAKKATGGQSAAKKAAPKKTAAKKAATRKKAG